MNGRLTRSLAFVAVALLTALPAQVKAQQQASARYRVLVPDFFPAEGVRKNFGEDVAKELRKALDQQI